MNDKPLKLCIWMNMPSHHQHGFFQALARFPNIDLAVRYYEEVSDERKHLGWNIDKVFMPYELDIHCDLNYALATMKDWKERIHIIPGFSSIFLNKLLELIINNNVKWIHWSERAGNKLAEILNFNYSVISIFYPTFLFLKGYYSFARKVNEYALGAFSQGITAKNDFLRWGIRADKISNLFYSIDTLKIKKDVFSQKQQNYKKSFCYVGSLSKLKGIDILLKAFSLLNFSEPWNLVLIGPDKRNGYFQRLASKYKINKKVSFIGQVTVNKVGSYLADSDVFILPTRFDGWGVVLNEASSLSKPIISTDQCGAAFHLIKNKVNGFRIKAGNVKQLQKSMQYYVDNPQQIIKHGNESYNMFKDYTPEKNAKRLSTAINYWNMNDNIN